MEWGWKETEEEATNKFKKKNQEREKERKKVFKRGRASPGLPKARCLPGWARVVPVSEKSGRRGLRARAGSSGCPRPSAGRRRRRSSPPLLPERRSGGGRGRARRLRGSGADHLRGRKFARRRGRGVAVEGRTGGAAMGSEGTIHTAGRVPPAPPCRCEGSSTRLGGPAWPLSLPRVLIWR